MFPRVFLPAIASGLLLWTAFFPLDCGPTAFVALAPFLTLVRAEGVSRRRRYLAAYAGGLAFYLPALQWIRVAHPMMYLSWIGLALYCSLYWVLALALLRRLDRLTKLPFAFTLPVVWIALDYVRAHFPTGFAFLKPLGLHQLVGFGWYMPGYTQHSVSPLIQTADFGGVYVLTGILAAFNGAVYGWAIRLPLLRSLLRWPLDAGIGFFREMWVSAFATFLVLAAIVYGTGKLQEAKFTEGPRVAALQGNVAQDDKMNDSDGLFLTYDKLCMTASKRADLVIWPETCSPFPWYAVAPGAKDVPADFNERAAFWRKWYAAAAGNHWKTNVLVGMGSIEWQEGQSWLYNSAVLFGPDGGDHGRYDKMHLVPFGEYVPFKATFPWLQAFTPYKHDYSCRPGEQETRFPLPVGDRLFTFGVLICYEDSDPTLARRYVAPGPEQPVDFLVNISNDGWFRGSEEHEQHLAICRFRAVEARRPIVRAVNMGISAVIDSSGKVQALPGDSWARSKAMEGMVTDKLKLDTRGSFYAVYGDWLPAGCWALLAVTGVLGLMQRRSSPRQGRL